MDAGVFGEIDGGEDTHWQDEESHQYHASGCAEYHWQNTRLVYIEHIGRRAGADKSPGDVRQAVDENVAQNDRQYPKNKQSGQTRRAGPKQRRPVNSGGTKTPALVTREIGSVWRCR